MKQDFAAIYTRADEAGKVAGRLIRPRPMTLVGGPPGEEPEVFYEPEGACGFAWVRVRGTQGFAKWLRANGKGRAWGDGKGTVIWVGDFNQSVARKEAYAEAFARVLNDAGIEAIAESRLD